MNENSYQDLNNKEIKNQNGDNLKKENFFFKWGKIDNSTFNNSSVSNSDIGESLIENSAFIDSKLKNVKNFHGKFIKCNFKSLALENYDGRDNILVSVFLMKLILKIQL